MSTANQKFYEALDDLTSRVKELEEAREEDKANIRRIVLLPAAERDFERIQQLIYQTTPLFGQLRDARGKAQRVLLLSEMNMRMSSISAICRSRSSL